MNFLIFFIKNIKTFISLEENVKIVLSEYPKWHIVVEDSIVRIKETDENFFGDFSPYVARIFLSNGRYQINYHGFYLFAEESNKEIKALPLDISEDGFYFNIVSTEAGQKIITNEKCFQKGQWDNNSNGYKLILADCSTNIFQFFDIEKAVKKVEDNDNENATIFVHDRNLFYNNNNKEYIQVY